MKVALICLMIWPVSLLFGQQTLNLTLVPQTGSYQAAYTYKIDTFALEYELRANVKDIVLQDRLAYASFKAFTYTDSLWLSDYSFLSKQSWKALRYQRPGFSLALLDDGKRQRAAMLQTGSFSALYLFGPESIQSDEIDLIWNRYLFGRNCIAQYRYEGKQVLFVLEGLWGEYRSLDFSTTMSLNIGPWTVQSQLKGHEWLKMRSVSLHVQGEGFELRHTWTTTLGLAPIHSGRYQTMNLSFSTKAAYKQIHLDYEQIFEFDAQGNQNQDRELQLLYSTAFVQVGLLFKPDNAPLVSLYSGFSSLTWGASSLAATFVFQRRWGSVTLRFRPPKGFTILYSYIFTSGLRSESLPQA